MDCHFFRTSLSSDLKSVTILSLSSIFFLRDLSSSFCLWSCSFCLSMMDLRSSLLKELLLLLFKFPLLTLLLTLLLLLLVSASLLVIPFAFLFPNPNPGLTNLWGRGPGLLSTSFANSSSLVTRGWSWTMVNKFLNLSFWKLSKGVDRPSALYILSPDVLELVPWPLAMGGRVWRQTCDGHSRKWAGINWQPNCFPISWKPFSESKHQWSAKCYLKAFWRQHLSLHGSGVLHFSTFHRFSIITFASPRCALTWGQNICKKFPLFTNYQYGKLLFAFFNICSCDNGENTNKIHSKDDELLWMMCYELDKIHIIIQFASWFSSTKAQLYMSDVHKTFPTKFLSDFAKKL